MVPGDTITFTNTVPAYTGLLKTVFGCVYTNALQGSSTTADNSTSGVNPFIDSRGVENTSVPALRVCAVGALHTTGTTPLWLLTKTGTSLNYVNTVDLGDGLAGSTPAGLQMFHRVETIDRVTPQAPLQISVPGGGVTAGNSIIVAVAGVDVTNVPTITVTDTKGNPYTQDVALFQPTNSKGVAIFSAHNVTALTGSDKINVQSSTPLMSFVASACEYTGLATSPFDKSATAAATGVDVVVGPTGVLTQLPELLIGAVSCLDTTTGTTWAPGTGWSLRSSKSQDISFGLPAVQVRFNDKVQATSPSIIALYDFISLQKTAGPGTVSTTAGSPVVTGVATTFNSATDDGTHGFKPGDIIEILGERRHVHSIQSATSLTATEVFVKTNTTVAYSIIVNQRLITASQDGNIYKDDAAGKIDAVTLVGGLNEAVSQGRLVPGGAEE